MMLAHVEKKNKRRLSPSEAEKLKMPLPDIDHRREHQRQHKQQGHRSSKDSKATKGIGRDLVIDGADDNITDDADAGHPHSQRHNPGWQNQTQLLSENDVDEDEDIDDAFVYQAMGDQQIEAMKQRLTSNIGYKSTDKYIEGDSYPDTTSGRLSEIDAQNQQDDLSVQAVQDTVMVSIPRTRSAGDYSQRHTQVPFAQQQHGFAQKSSTAQPLFSRPVDVAHNNPSFQMSANRRGQSAAQQVDMPHDNNGSFQMSAIRRTQSTTQPVAPLPLSAAKKQSRPASRANLYQPAQSSRAAPAEAQTKPAVPRAMFFKDQHSPIHKAMPANDSDDYSSEHNHTRADQAHLPASQEDGKMSLPLLLDHEPQTLHQMGYKHLTEEPFDHDPQADPSSIPLNDSSEPLTSKLDSLTALSPDEWSYFFYSLDLEKWEYAGDWFIARYAAILSRLKDIRRQRRSAAHAFELEVEQRQQAVVNKRIAIRNAMDSMRTHGAQVLVTPGKATG